MKPFLVITQLIYTGCLVAWLVVWLMSFMVFDSGVSFWNSLFFLLVSLFPVAVVVCSIIAWVVHKRRPRTAITLNLIPMLWVVSFGVIMFIS
ncbi:magnesium-transporting ATPase (P-type) [Paenibacillus wynnii]|nr:magnesium-transporting ATPase (P-type) [Paenibacillus wynnii]